MGNKTAFLLILLAGGVGFAVAATAPAGRKPRPLSSIDSAWEPKC